MEPAKNIFSYRQFWAKRFGIAKYLPMSKEEMDDLGWDSCDIILVTGDAYVDHPSFGMALIGRLLESQGFRVGIISQPDWMSAEAFKILGRPNLFFGVTAGNMDSMINRYTADRRIRSDDAYTAGAEGGKRPDHSVVVYAQRAREAFNDVPIIIGGIEASLRRIAHYDYWSDKVKRSVLHDSKADMLVYGNAERQIVEIAHRLAARESIHELTDIRGTAYFRKELPRDWHEIDSTHIDEPGHVGEITNPYAENTYTSESKPATSTEAIVDFQPRLEKKRISRIEKFDRATSYIRLPSYEQVTSDKVLYAHTSRILHLETNPGNARALVQRYGKRDIWLNPPPIPLTTKEMDRLFALPYTRLPHTQYEGNKIPAYEMIRFSINIMRGCFGGCTFCSITEHEGRIIQNRSEDSIIQEIETIRDTVPGFTGIISDLGGPTANMYRLACKTREIEAACRKPSCVYPGICHNLGTDHSPLVSLYKRARKLPGIKKVLIGSGVRYDLAVESPEYVEELVAHHVGGYLKIAPEHTEENTLSKMMKPGIGTYDRFKEMFEAATKKAGKEQYLIPYFIAAHPGTTNEDMMNLAVWLKKNGFRADQVQTFIPSPMATASAMYYSGKNPLKRVTHNSEDLVVAKNLKVRRLHKAFLRYHDPRNWPILRQALKEMGRADLIGNGKRHLIPSFQPKGTLDKNDGEKTARAKPFVTKHTGEYAGKGKEKKKAGKKKRTFKKKNTKK
ncbi:MAG: YgiQ family radical SAM protein [Gammaproteobacteria bacterium]|nr:YgiQ family radical SAM protein [Gammaproteobacteria bacterium]